MDESLEPTWLFCTFSVGGLEIGVDALVIQEVVRRDKVTLVPLAPAAVRGLINLRGQLVTVMDLGVCLDLPTDPASDLHVVCMHDRELVTLLVDEVGDVVSPAMEDFEEIPRSVDPRVKSVVTGAFKLQDKLMLVLSVPAVIAQHLYGPGERVAGSSVSS
jgi:purine-binding chemotaxis protein CheW